MDTVFSDFTVWRLAQKLRNTSRNPREENIARALNDSGKRRETSSNNKDLNLIIIVQSHLNRNSFSKAFLTSRRFWNSNNRIEIEITNGEINIHILKYITNPTPGLTSVLLRRFVSTTRFHQKTMALRYTWQYAWLYAYLHGNAIIFVCIVQTW